MITFDDVSFAYDRTTVLDGLSATVGDGLTFLVGENGAGKTTVMRLVLGLERPRTGRVTVDGGRAGGSRGPGVRSRVGYVPQDFAFPRSTTLATFVEYLGWLRNMPPREIAGAARHALARVGLADRSEHAMGELSGGMVRRAGIAQAIVHDPTVLLLDEPTVGLDPRHRIELRELLVSMSADITVLCSTHLLEDVSLTGGSMLVLADGRFVYDGPSDVLQQRGERDGNGPSSALEDAFIDLIGTNRTAS